MIGTRHITWQVAAKEKVPQSLPLGVTESGGGGDLHPKFFTTPALLFVVTGIPHQLRLKPPVTQVMGPQEGGGAMLDNDSIIKVATFKRHYSAVKQRVGGGWRFDRRRLAIFW